MKFWVYESLFFDFYIWVDVKFIFNSINLYFILVIRFEIDKERKIAAHKRAVLRKESQISEHSRRLHDIQKLVSQEKIKAIQTSNEFSHLLRVRYHIGFGQLFLL